MRASARRTAAITQGWRWRKGVSRGHGHEIRQREGRAARCGAQGKPQAPQGPGSEEVPGHRTGSSGRGRRRTASAGFRSAACNWSQSRPKARLIFKGHRDSRSGAPMAPVAGRDRGFHGSYQDCRRPPLEGRHSHQRREKRGAAIDGGGVVVGSPSDAHQCAEPRRRPLHGRDPSPAGRAGRRARGWGVRIAVAAAAARKVPLSMRSAIT